MALAAPAVWPAGLSAADPVADPLSLGRSLYASDRQATVAEAMQLTEAEGKAFWPLYRQYCAEREKLGDSLIKLVLEYADLYPDVPEHRARQLLGEYTALEKKLGDQRASYLKKFAKTLPASKTLRFAQVENRLDLVLRLQLASAIPLMPIEGQLGGVTAGAASVAKGLPGGVVVQTHRLTATITAIDKANRRLMLLSPDGIKQTVKVGREAVNFDQIRVGDQLTVTVAEELVVSVVGEGESPAAGAADLVVLAPKGAKPGGLVATAQQVTAKVVAIDREQRQATLQFEDGTTRTVAVRPDVDLGKRQVGDKVVIRITEALAISVEKP